MRTEREKVDGMEPRYSGRQSGRSRRPEGVTSIVVTVPPSLADPAFGDATADAIRPSSPKSEHFVGGIGLAEVMARSRMRLARYAPVTLWLESPNAKR